MDQEKIKKYVEDLEKWNRLNIATLDYFFAKWILILKGKNKEVFNLLLEALKHNDQVIVGHIADIIGKIGNKKAIPYLRDALERNDLWGFAALSIGIALIRLGDKAGVDFLKKQIITIHVHRELRINAAKALIRLRVRNVFGKDEKIDFGGETMTTEWSTVLQDLVRRLHAR